MDAVSDVNVPQCGKHNRVIEYFCKDDQEPICSRCYIMGDHKDHTIESFEEKNKSTIASVENGMETATIVYNKLSKVDKNFVSNQLKSEKSKLVEKITQTFTSMHSAIKQRQAILLNELDKIYDDQISSVKNVVENAKNDKQKLGKALSDSKALLQNPSIIIDGETLQTTINAASYIPCILSQLSSNVKWDQTHIEDIVDAINSFGTVQVAAKESIRLKTIEEAPETIEERDKIFHIPTPSQKRDSISSVDTGEDVIIESDTDSVSTSLSISSVSTNHSYNGSSNKEVIAPQVKGQCKQVTVTHIRSPNDFFVQLPSNRVNLEKLSRNMNIWCRKKSSVQYIPNALERGMLVMACYSEDKQWYRARVLDVDVNGHNGMRAHIMYFDFGNEESVSLKSLRTMDPRFSRYPPFCFHCSLYDITPLQKADWDVNTIQEFFRLTRNQVLLLNAIAMKGQTYEVDLICQPAADVLDDQFSSIRDMLIFLDLAKFAKPSQSATSASFKTVKYFKPTPLPVGELVEMTVSEASSPTNLYIMPDGEEKLYYLNMMQEMKEAYNNDATGLYTMYCPRKDGVCSVKGPDNKWHRARILSTPKHSKVTVFLVDRGSTLVVSYDKVKKLLSDFIKLPAQAVYCSLADVGYTNPGLGDWNEDAKVWCRSDLKGAQGTVRIVRWGEQTQVVLWLGSNTSHSSVNALLVEAGLATSTGIASMPAVTVKETNTYTKNQTGNQQDPSGLDSPKSTGSCSSSHTVTSNSRSPTVGSSVKGRQSSKKKTAPVYVSPAASRSKQMSQANVSVESSCSPSKVTTMSKSSHGTSSDKTATEMSSAIPPAKSKREKRPKKDRLRSRGDEEEESGSLKCERLESFASAEEAARKKRVQEEIHKAIGGKAAKQGAGDGESLYIEILVGCYKSPSDFYIRIQEQDAALKDLMVELNQEYKDSEPVPDQKWNVDDFCVVMRSGDQRWYRAKIISVPSDVDVEVELLDYGETFSVAHVELRPLIGDLGMRLNRAAVRCHLAGLIPTGSSDRNKWSRTATEFMDNLVNTRKLYIKTEDEPSESGLPIDIIVEEKIPETPFDPVTFTYHSLRQKMVDEGLAMFDKSQRQRPLPVSSAASPSANSEKEKSSVEKDSYIQPPAPSVVELPPYSIPDLNARIEVIPTFVDFSGIIYAQEADWEEKVAHLSQELQRVYKDSPQCHRRWSLGDVCVAPFVDDGMWYRGLIEDMDGTKVKVFYVDFGNSAWLTTDKLREISSPFAQYHIQVYHCMLEDLEPNTSDGKWPTPVLDVVHEMVVNAQCSMVYKGMMDNGYLKITLGRQDGFDLSTYLLDNGYAVSTADLQDRYVHSKAVGDILNRSGMCSHPDLGVAGNIFHAMTTEVELPNVIYIQRLHMDEENIHDFVRASEVAVINRELLQFEKMMEAIKETPSSGFIKLPDVGMLCLAKYHFDDCWYRALCVEKIQEMDSNLVVFIDFGTSEIVSKDCLRTLPSQFWDLPSQGIRCHLNLIPPGGPDSVWKKNSLDAMVAALSQKPLTVKVVQSSPLMVELFEESEGGELNLAYEELIQRGLAWLPMQINADVLMSGGGLVVGKMSEGVEVEEEELVEDESGYVGSEAAAVGGCQAAGVGGSESGKSGCRNENNSYCGQEEEREEKNDQLEQCCVDVLKGEKDEEEVKDDDAVVVSEEDDVEDKSNDEDDVGDDGWATASDEDEGSAV